MSAAENARIGSRVADGRVWYSADDLIAVLRALADVATNVDAIVVLRSVADSLDLATLTYITEQPGDSEAER